MALLTMKKTLKVVAFFTTRQNILFETHVSSTAIIVCFSLRAINMSSKLSAQSH